MPKRLIVFMFALCLLPTGSAVAQAVPYAVPAPDEGWRITIYPVLAWVPSGIETDLSLPPSDGDAGFAGEIVDSRFDGAFLGGFSAAKGAWRIDADGLWAAFGGDRLELPVFTVDADVIYLHVSGGCQAFQGSLRDGRRPPICGEVRHRRRRLRQLRAKAWRVGSADRSRLAHPGTDLRVACHLRGRRVRRRRGCRCGHFGAGGLEADSDTSASPGAISSSTSRSPMTRWAARSR